MSVLAYILSVILVPALSAVSPLVMLPFVLLSTKLPSKIVPLVTALLAIAEAFFQGFIVVWGCKKLFEFCGVTFSPPVLWLIAILFIQNDWRRCQGSRSILALSNEALHLIFTPLSIALWATWELQIPTVIKTFFSLH